MKKVFFAAALIFLAVQSCTYKKGEIKKASQCDSIISYSATIMPIVNAQCLGCHVAGGTGSGDFSTYTELKLKADNGTLKNRIVTIKDMPTPGSGFTLTDEERQKFACWIEQGAPAN